MNHNSSWFPASYEESRERFRQNLARVQTFWPGAQLHQHRLMGVEDLTIDWITAKAVEQTEKILVLTTAEHGIEGYVRSAMLSYFFEHVQNQRIEKWVESDFQEMFYPQEDKWNKAFADADQAFDNILQAQGYLRNP